MELKSEKSNAHSDFIRSVAFSPDGKTIVSGSDDKSIKVWDCSAIGTASQWEKKKEKGKKKGLFSKRQDIDVWINTISGEKRYTDPGVLHAFE